MKRVRVPSRRWYENEERELTFPDRWEVDNLTSPGLDKPGLTPEEVAAKIARPVSGPALEELARGRKQAVIVFDDMTRPTPAKEVATAILDACTGPGCGGTRSGSSGRWGVTPPTT